MANAPVRVTVNMSIKVPAETFRYSYIYLNTSDVSNDHISCRKLKKNNGISFFFCSNSIIICLPVLHLQFYDAIPVTLFGTLSAGIQNGT